MLDQQVVRPLKDRMRKDAKFRESIPFTYVSWLSRIMHASG